MPVARAFASGAGRSHEARAASARRPDPGLRILDLITRLVCNSSERVLPPPGSTPGEAPLALAGGSSGGEPQGVGRHDLLDDPGNPGCLRHQNINLVLAQNALVEFQRKGRTQR